MKAATMIPIEDINSSGIRREAEEHGITHVRFLGEGGEGENHITVYGLMSPNGYEYRVANTNGLPVWEEQDLGEFAELLASVGVDLR